MTDRRNGRTPEIRTCPYVKKCGGCRTIGQPYEETLRKKRAYVTKLLAPYGKVEGIAGMEDPYHYRNKVHAVFAHVWDGRRERNIAGIYREGTHKVVSVDSCLIEDGRAHPIIRDVLRLLPSFKWKVYDEDSGYGLIRHILIRTAHSTGQIMVVLVTASPMLPGKSHFVKELVRLHPEITTIVQNVNPKKTTMVLGERESVAYGKGYIEDELLGKTYRISAKSFYQINSLQTEVLYRKALEFAGLTGRERVVDTYCGIGTIALSAADRAAEVTGVELNAQAVRDAKWNAKRNGADNVQFLQGDAGRFLTEQVRSGKRADVIFMDPPRSGSTEEFLLAADAAGPKRIVYISCEPETLARDLAFLKNLGWKAVRIAAVDMFPFTEDIESICLLERVKP